MENRSVTFLSPTSKPMTREQLMATQLVLTPLNRKELNAGDHVVIYDETENRVLHCGTALTRLTADGTFLLWDATFSGRKAHRVSLADVSPTLQEEPHEGDSKHFLFILPRSIDPALWEDIEINVSLSLLIHQYPELAVEVLNDENDG